MFFEDNVCKIRFFFVTLRRKYNKNFLTLRMSRRISSILPFLLLFFVSFSACKAKNTTETALNEAPSVTESRTLLTGADQTELYLPMLEGKRVAMLVNQTSVISNGQGGYTPLVDSLIDRDVDVRFLMAPEHGIKGLVSAGDPVSDSHYQKKKDLTIYSLYGKNKKPSAEMLADADVVVFDIQDVGCRFYTYLSTLFYLLEACGEQHKEVIILDRPNPNDTIDGPVLKDDKFKSFVGIVPVPLMHGCTLGELAQMMTGEGWTGKQEPELTVISCRNWTHGQPYDLPIAPSPNLQNSHAIRLYPSLCLFEATNVSVGRGTPWPFEVVGMPGLKGDFTFTPKSCEAATNPLQNGKLCSGYDLRNTDVPVGFHLNWVMKCAKEIGASWVTQKSFFDRLAGTDKLRQMIDAGKSEDEIRATWQDELKAFRQTRSKYIIYK